MFLQCNCIDVIGGQCDASVQRIQLASFQPRHVVELSVAGSRSSEGSQTMEQYGKCGALGQFGHDGKRTFDRQHKNASLTNLFARVWETR